MTILEKLIDFCETRLLILDESQFAAFGSDVAQRPLSDFNVGQVFTLQYGGNPEAELVTRHYCVPNPPSPTRDEFHALRSAWQTESSTEG